MALRLSSRNFSDVTTIGAQGSFYSHNIWGDQSDISISPDGTKIAVVSKGASSVCVHDLNNSGASISSGCTQVGGKPNGRPNQNYDRSSLINTEKVCTEVLSLPMFPEITYEEQVYISDSLNSVLEKTIKEVQISA